MLQEVVHMMQENIRKHLKKCHTAVPGKVVKYYPEKGMCDIQPVMQFKKPNGEWIDYAELKDVPVWWPQTFLQESTFVYPIKKDDEVLVLIMERPIDYWLFGMQTEQDLMFDLSEAICIPGLFAKPNRLAKIAQDEEAIIIQRKDTFIKIKEREVIVDSQGIVTVNALDDVTVNTEKNMTINAKKDMTINAENIYLNAEVDIGVVADGLDVEGTDAHVSAEMDIVGDITHSGDTTETGDISVTGGVTTTADVVAGGISLMTHVHDDSVEGETSVPTGNGEPSQGGGGGGGSGGIEPSPGQPKELVEGLTEEELLELLEDLLDDLTEE